MKEHFDEIVDQGLGRRGPGRTWAILLAGGDGTRLASVAKDEYGYPRPKQFCSFGFDEPLLERTVRRALELVPEHRIVVSTQRLHRAEALQCLASYPAVRWVEQPRNADTLPGLTMAVLSLLSEDPDATLVVLPADHWLDDDHLFAHTLRRTVDDVADEPGFVAILGAHVDPGEDGYGWILAGGRTTWAPVRRFVEKPHPAERERLQAEGALANTLVLVAKARTLARLVRAARPDWWEALCEGLWQEGVLAEAYRALAPANLSHEVLETRPEVLRLVPLDGVAWTDVGTPDRLDRALARERAGRVQDPPAGRT